MNDQKILESSDKAGEIIFSMNIILDSKLFCENNFFFFPNFQRILKLSLGITFPT